MFRLNERKEMNKELTPEEKLALRKAQWEKAMEGDTRMLIFLGKQYLGQQDTPHDNDGLDLFRGVQLVMPDNLEND
jgi:hypothetical protein